MSYQDKLLSATKDKAKLKIILTLLDQCVTILSAVEITSPQYAKKIQHIIDEFDKLIQ